MINETKETPTILLVEDSASQAQVLRRLLQRHNYNVVMAENGLVGTTKAQDIHPSLVISDVNMPIMNGYEMCKSIKNNQTLKHIPVILLTELSDPDDIIYGLECGADNFIIKPYTEKSLMSRIEYLLATSRIMKSDGPSVGIELSLGNRTYMINSEKRQILNLLVSTYERTVEQNRQLKDKERELTELNLMLEQRVLEETKRRMEKEQLLVQQAKMAEMGSMINAIAHQWRQPLNVLSATAQDIDEAYEYGEVNREYLIGFKDTILTQVDFMTKTVDDFCSFLRPSKAKSDFDIKKAIKEIVSMFSPYFTKNGISLNIAFIEDEVFALGFPNEFKQVILNLINNARDAILLKRGASGQYSEGRVDIRVTKENGAVKIIVSDNGGGIPSDIMNRIFEPYFTTKEVQKSSGIGLYMSKTIIENHMGWKLYAVSIEGGAEFIIEI